VTDRTCLGSHRNLLPVFTTPRSTHRPAGAPHRRPHRRRISRPALGPVRGSFHTAHVYLFLPTLSIPNPFLPSSFHNSLSSTDRLSLFLPPQHRRQRSSSNLSRNHHKVCKPASYLLWHIFQIAAAARLAALIEFFGRLPRPDFEIDPSGRRLLSRRLPVLPCHAHLEPGFGLLLPEIWELRHLNSAGEIFLFLPRGLREMLQLTRVGSFSPFPLLSPS
jgi:hypothetical protein